jgi:hypothetical protein
MMKNKIFNFQFNVSMKIINISRTLMHAITLGRVMQYYKFFNKYEHILIRMYYIKIIFGNIIKTILLDINNNK